MRLQFRDIEHLLRLAALGIGALLVFVALREALVPDDFGLIGHYRASAVEANRAKPIAYAGQKACVECHDDVGTAKAAGAHAPVACEGCHGPLAKHAAAPDEIRPERPDGATICIRCHAASTGKPAWYRTVDVKDHAGGERCTTCHVAHSPRLG